MAWSSAEAPTTVARTRTQYHSGQNRSYLRPVFEPDCNVVKESRFDPARFARGRVDEHAVRRASCDDDIDDGAALVRISHERGLCPHCRTRIRRCRSGGDEQRCGITARLLAGCPSKSSTATGDIPRALGRRAVKPPVASLRVRPNMCEDRRVWQAWTDGRRAGVLTVGLWIAGAGLAVGQGLPVAVGDFAHDFYPAGREVLHGYLQYHQPPYIVQNVDVFRYPPFAAVLIAPFALMSLHAAIYVWWIVSIAMVAASAILLGRLFPEKRGLLSGLIFVGCMSFAPIGVSLTGVVDNWVLALISGAVVLTRPGGTDQSWRPIVAGALLGLAIAIKIYPLIILVVLMGARPSIAWRLAFGCVVALIFAVAIGIAVVGVAPLRSFFALAGTGSTVLTATPWAFGALNISARLLTANPYARPLIHISPHLLNAAFAAYVLIVIGFVARRLYRSRSRWALPWIMAIMVGAACSPFLELAHLAPIVLIPVLLTLESRYPPDVAVGMVGAAVLCVCVSLIAPTKPAELVCALIVGVSLVATWRVANFALALITGGLLLLAAPPLAYRYATWTINVSRLHVLEGSLDFVALLIVLTGLLIATSSGSARGQLHDASHVRYAGLRGRCRPSSPS